MKSTIFRTYDIRGRIPTEFTIKNAYLLARAILLFYQKIDPTLHSIILGADGRLSSPIIKREVLRACQDLRISVVDIGLCPTPVFSYTLHTHSVQSGIMITASHNKADFNGFKMRINTEPVWGDQIKEIERIYQFLERENEAGNQSPLYINTDSHEQAIIEKKHHCLVTRVTQFDAINAYITFLTKQFSHLIGIKTPLIIDCAHGVTGRVIPRLIKAFQWTEAAPLFEALNGSFPAHDPDPSQEKNLKQLQDIIKRGENKILGLALDGDGDRLGALTESGTIVYNDELLALFSIPILQEHDNSPIIYDSVCSRSLLKTINKYRGTGTMSPCGNPYIRQFMTKHNALLGGELSGHFFFADRYFGYDDGIYAILRLVEILVSEKKPLSQLVTQIRTTVLTPEMRIPCPENLHAVILSTLEKQLCDRTDITLHKFDGIRAEYPYGWGSLRASRTESVLSFRFEAETESDLAQIKNDFKRALSELIEI